MMTDGPTLLVAITGGSGSGKTWLADQLQGLLGEKAGRLTQDNFYRDRSHLPPSRRAALNFDHPDALDWDCFQSALTALGAGQPAQVPKYDYHTHCRQADGELVQPRPVMIVDGLWLLHRPEVRRLFSLRVFLDCPERERLRRRLQRDCRERGRSVEAGRRQFLTTVEPMHRRYVDPQARHADRVLNFPWPDNAVGELHEALRRLRPDDAFQSDRQRAISRAESVVPSPSTSLVFA